MQYRNWITLVFSVLWFGSSSGQQFNIDKSIINESPPGPRSAGMGRAQTAIAAGIYSLANNPAGLYAAEKTCGALSGLINLGDTRIAPPQNFADFRNYAVNQRGTAAINFAGFVLPVKNKKWDFVGAVVMRSLSNLQNNKSFQFTDEKNKNDQFLETDGSGGLYALGGGFAAKLFSGITLGVGVNLIFGSHESRTSDRFAALTDTVISWENWSNRFSGTAVDLGLIWQPAPTFSFGTKINFPYTIKLSNIQYTNSNGKNLSYEIDAKIRRSVAISYGIGLHPLESFTLAVDYRYQPFSRASVSIGGAEFPGYFKNSNTFHVGVEYVFSDGDIRIPVRWGFFSRPEQVESYSTVEKENPVTSRFITAGFGLDSDNFSLNLSLEYNIMRYNQDLMGTNQPFGIHQSNLQLVAGIDIKL